MSADIEFTSSAASEIAQSPVGALAIEFTVVAEQVLEEVAPAVTDLEMEAETA